MFDILTKGGPVMWLLVLMAVAAVTLFIERGFHVHRARIKTLDFLKGIANIVRRKNFAEAVVICEETPGPVASIMRAAILNREQDRSGIQKAMDQAALREIARLERRLLMLSSIGQAAPLIGLLGGVLALIQSFLIIQAKGPLVHSGDLALGMWQALFTAAGGIVVALFCQLTHNLLVSKIDAIVLDMEMAVADILALFTGSSVWIDE